MFSQVLPPQPTADQWEFVHELQEPLWKAHHWAARPPHASEADLRHGAKIVAGSDDPDGLLATAYDDLKRFLRTGDVCLVADYTIETGYTPTDIPETFHVEVTPHRCRILAGETEGIRRGIFFIEDEMLRAGGPFLPLGTAERSPFIRRRISRCFFGPIKRPPGNRDELMDEVDYYPDEYLNRLAHDGVNGLWLTIEFRDLCNTSITPAYGQDAEKRLVKLRRTVDKCRRYGIQTYVFCIEPRAWEPDSPVLTRHPEMGRGGTTYDSRLLFCPFSEAAQTYLYEAVNGIFTAVPNLGGLINISHGERSTSCLSALAATGQGTMHCPVCSQKEPWEILHASLSAMESGMRDANPQAALISWLYMPQSDDLADWVYEIPAHTPENVILQFNFESGVKKQQLGSLQTGGDYWLSAPGPSDRFVRVARTARDHGARVSAKIQTGCSHEVASVPFVPIPAQLHQKFSSMRELGVDTAMLCWYFGNYPGLMNKAAGELSFEPFSESSEDFLLSLAQIYWGDDAQTVCEAWRRFTEGYVNYPLTNMFQYYGPVHDGPVWPLLLKPQDAPLNPTWQISSPHTLEPFPPGGDRIGESFCPSHTLEQVLELTRQMTESWDRGVALLESIEHRYVNDRQRLLDIGVAKALAIQFRSGYNIFRFYDLREKMLRMDGLERLDLLDEMRSIAEEELANNQTLLALCERDSRLGFHSEAEGYKYYPAKIRWRMQQLRDVLFTDFSEFEHSIRNGQLLNPEYTGRKITGPSVVCRRVPDAASCWENPERGFPEGVEFRYSEVSNLAPGQETDDRKTKWAVCRDDAALYLLFRCVEPNMNTLLELETAENTSTAIGTDSVILKLEPRRLYPCRRFVVIAGGGTSTEGDFGATVVRADDGWQGTMRIPFASIELDPATLTPIRIDVQRLLPGEQTSGNNVGFFWIEQHPFHPRLRLGADNPADLGWVVFE